MAKEFKASKVNNDLYELYTINLENGEETVSKFKKATVLDIHKQLLSNKGRIEQTLSQKNKELGTFEDIERELGEKYKDEEVVRFAELGALADSRGKKAGVQGQINEAKEMLEQIRNQVKHIEVAIPELMRK